jgi:hypothetical protein
LQKPNGLTDREQATVLGLSGAMIALAAIVIPSDFPYHEYVGIFLAALGALGFYLKEWAGGAITTNQITVDSMATSLNALLQIQLQAQKPQQQPSQPPIDKAKLAAEITQMALDAIEKVSNPQPAAASSK